VRGWFDNYDFQELILEGTLSFCYNPLKKNMTGVILCVILNVQETVAQTASQSRSEEPSGHINDLTSKKNPVTGCASRKELATSSLE
jgi:hypothetical protein